MPLPAGGNTPWPPKQCEPINRQIATWAAWYAGDVDQLAAVYSGAGGTQDTTGFFASEHGGFKATVRRAGQTIRRWFWGERRGTSQPRMRLHVPIASDIASASADLLFSEPPTVTVAPASVPGPDGQPTPDTVTQDRLNELLDDGAHATLLEGAEICSALGGVYLRIVWDKTVRDKPWLTAIQPDVAVPEWTWGRLSAVTFSQEILRKGKIVVRHLERHEKGMILHGVYEGTNDELGRPAALTDYDATRGLANEHLVNGNEIQTGATGMTAVYVPNMRPNRLWRTNPDAAYLGRSDYAGVEPLMDALDMTYSSWMRDVDLGKARLIVPQEYLQSNGPGKGASVDLDQEVYEGINSMAAEDGKAEIKEVQFKIRHVEHAATVTDLKTSIVTSAGYSAQTFGLDSAGQAVTATEIAAQNRRSLITRDRKSRYWRSELADLYETWLAVDVTVFQSGVTPQRPTIEFADAVSVDPLAQAQTLRELDTARAISTEQKVRTLHPDWDGDDVDAEVARIIAETGQAVTNPDTFTGLGGGPDQNVPEPVPAGG